VTKSHGRWFVMAHLAAIYVISTIPTPLYTLYRNAFGFSEVMLTIIYAVYVVGSIAAMFLLGRLSDQVGRRPVVLGAAVVAVASAVIFLCASSTSWLFAGRIVSGLAVALVPGASTAWLLELDPRGDIAAATRMATIGNLAGLAVGPMLAGCLAQWAPWPRHLSYVVYLVLVIPLACCAARVPEMVKDTRPWREVSLAPRLGVPRDIRREFLPAALGAFAIFAVLGFYAALVPSLLRNLLHVPDLAIAGAIVGEAFLVGTIAAGVSRKLDPRRWLVIALVLLVPGLALLVATELAHSLVLLIIGTAVTGGAGGLGYRTSLQLVNEIAPEDRRSEVVSAFVIVCYTSVSFPIIGVGVLALVTGFATAAIAFAALVCAIAVAALISELVLGD
jgi:MFS family permease